MTSRKTRYLIEMAEALPIDEKAMLVDRLLDSMYPLQAEIDEPQKVEVERRIGEVDSGKVQTIPAEKVFEEIKKRFGR